MPQVQVINSCMLGALTSYHLSFVPKTGCIWKHDVDHISELTKCLKVSVDKHIFRNAAQQRDSNRPNGFDIHILRLELPDYSVLMEEHRLRA